MAWFVAQVWVLCALAFLLGAGVTWLLFVRPRAAQQRSEPWPRQPEAPRAVPPHEVPPRPEEPAGPPTVPALAVLDTPPMQVQPGIGARASGTLDQLGVTPSGPAPTIPTQPGPAEDGTRT